MAMKNENNIIDPKQQPSGIWITPELEVLSVKTDTQAGYVYGMPDDGGAS